MKKNLEKIEFCNRRNEGSNWNVWKESDVAGAITLKNGFVLAEEKSRIEKRFCFADEGPELDFYHELNQNDEKMKKYFFNENMNEINFYLDLLQKRNDISKSWPKFVGAYIDKDTRTATLTFRNYCNLSDEYDILEGLKKHEMEPNFYLLEGEDLENTIRMMEEVKTDFEKRLATWWKKYGAEKLHTWTYWRDA